MLRMSRKKCAPANGFSLPRRRAGVRPKPRRNQSLVFESLEPRLVLGGSPIISEFMAVNKTTLADADGDYSDWLEIFNPGDTRVDLTGWQLEDSGNTWTLPAVYLDPGGFRLIFASGKDRTDPAGELHTNFSLKGDGEYLGLLDRTGAVVHEYNDYPAQTADLSYGIGQNVDKTTFVSLGDSARYRVPPGTVLGWTAPGYNDTAWSTGATPLGYVDTVPGLAVHNYKANISVGDLNTALGVLSDPSKQSYVFAENVGVINYFNTGGQGQYTINERDFPGFTGGDMNDFVIEATGLVTIPSAGLWSFGVNSDDGFQLTIPGATVTEVNNSSTPAGGDTISFFYGRGPDNTIGVFSFPQAGVYNLRLVTFEGGGGSSAELFAAPDSRLWFDAAAFDLVGDTANGGLAIASLPVGGSGSGSQIYDLVETDVKAQMMGVNPSMYVRIPFTVDDPSLYTSLTLRMKYDDGYVAYLNGAEVARKNAPPTPRWNSRATANRTDAQAVAWEDVNISADVDQLVAGTNVLAIQAMNYAASDPDFLVAPELAQILYSGAGEHFFIEPTPGEANVEEYWLRAEDTKFSVDRGFYDAPFSLQITTATADAQIYYTVDGSEPTETNGTLYTAPISITGTTVVRAAAFARYYAPSDVDTQTYIFLDQVLQQPANPGEVDGYHPPGVDDYWPQTWTGQSGAMTANYQVDPDVVNDPDYANTIKDDLRSIPTVSIVTDRDSLWDPNTGIYTNPLAEAAGLEYPASVEMIDGDGTTLFQANVGLRLQGGYARNLFNKKHSFRLLFKSEYGSSKLTYPWFGDNAVDEFDTITLRAGFNDVWPNQGWASYLSDRWAAESQLALGGVASHGTYVHLYVNGLYWGLYNPVERPDASFAANYFGGSKDQYDVRSIEGLKEGNDLAWNQLRTLLNDPVTNYAAVEQMLDIPNFIDYMVMNQFGGNWDWPHNNWWATYNREGGKWHFHSWDAEGCLWDVNANRVNEVGSDLGWIYQQLRLVPEFVRVFGDRVYRSLFNDGPLTPAANIERINGLASVIDRAIVGEAARWGDGYDDAWNPPQSRDDSWVPRINWLRDTYFPQRTAVVIQQYIDNGLYPSVVAPTLLVQGVPQHGGTFKPGQTLTLTAPAGTIYYTTDGTDPRPIGGGAPDPADRYTGAIALDAGLHVMARVYSGSAWSALDEASFYADLAPDIRITELMYNPADPTPAEIAATFLDNDDFEYIEIKNLSATQTLPLGGLRLTDGVDFTFPNLSIAPGQYMVVVKNEAAFRFRYPAYAGTIAGEYTGSLNNAGEKIELDAPVGGIIHYFAYKDSWYDHTDGEGFSLTIRDPGGAAGLWALKDGWRPSAAPGGTPGYDDQLTTPGSIVISEVLAHGNAPMADAIELHNVGDSPVDVSGWFLSNEKTDALGNPALTKYQIPAMPPIAVGDYAVFHANPLFGGAFALSEFGDDVYLSSNAGGVAGGYREHVDFGASPTNVSVGLHTKSTGDTDFTLLSTPTFGSDNSPPYLEDLAINEVMYHPGLPTAGEAAAGFQDADGFEFIEIYNRSATTAYPLKDYYVGDGVGFSFGWYDAGNADPASHQAWTLESGATAAWNAVLPAGAASYEVFARWDLLDGLGGERNLDGQARYAITHGGGTTTVVRDQKPELDDEGPDYMDPQGWVSLGTYTFDGSGQVVLTRGTTDPGNWTIADAVKFVSATTEVIDDDPVLDSWYTSNGPATIGPGEYVAIVADYAAFDARYDVAGNGIPVAGVYTGSLGNNGEKIELMRAGNPEPLTGYLPYYRIDFVDYDDTLPWPVEADGRGSSLNRLDAAQYGNDPIRWEAGNHRGSPGTANVAMDRTGPWAPTVLTGQVTLDPDTISLCWNAAQDPESYVDYYIVYRDGGYLGTTTGLAYDDTDVVMAVAHVYKVSAVNRDGYEGPLSNALVMAMPGIVTYEVTDTTHIAITLSEPLDPATAGVLSNYVMTGATPVGVQVNGARVTLNLAAQLVIGNSYSVTLHGLTTLSGNEMRDHQQIAFTYEPQGAGYILREYWTGIGGSSIADLTNNPNYPDNPTGVTFPTAMEGPLNWSDDYGTRLRGFVHPPKSGMYTFWISGDDNCNLYLSTDADPANKVLIALVPGWTDFRTYTTFTVQQSVPISLVAGQKYYIEALQKEGGGGDSVSVRWQLPDGVWENPADERLPIPGVRLSPYIDDTTAPTADVVDVVPDPRETPVDQIQIAFSERIGGLDVGDLSLTRNGGGNLLGAGQTVSTTDGITWTLSGLSGVTSPVGAYVLTVHAVGSGITDLIGNPLAGDASDAWITNAAPPYADIRDVTPDPRNAALGQIQIVFTEAVTGFDLSDLRLTRDGGGNLLGGGQSLQTADNVTWTLSGLNGPTGVDGVYTLTLVAAGSGIKNALQMSLAEDASDTWRRDTQAPTVDIVDVTPDPRDAAVTSVDLVFSEPVTGLEVGDLVLTRDGGANLLTGAESLDTADNVTWTLRGLGTLTGTPGGFVAFNDHIAGPATHPNATAYAGNAVTSGLLKDIQTGLDTGVTLTITGVGIGYDNQNSNLPAEGTDAFNTFNGFVDFSKADGDSLETAGASSYTHAFTGLDTGDLITYQFAGTAIRGNNYYNRWTLVTLEGAVSAVPAHSTGDSIVVISPTQVAFNAGDNNDPTSGVIAAWTDIDPGPDGAFSVISTQYTGDTPLGPANGSKTYSLTAVRLAEVVPTGTDGVYRLSLAAAGSGVVDAAGNPLAVGAADTWIIGEGGPAQVEARHVFYNNSSFDGFTAGASPDDDAAIAPDPAAAEPQLGKTALLPGQTATFQNYTSYVAGINGLMIDIAGLPGTLSPDDFDFRAGNTADPAQWSAVVDPVVSVRPGDGVNGSDRVTLIWPDGTIVGSWLQVTVKANANTRLQQPDVFYFGNAIGEAGNQAGNAIVNATDEIMARNFYHGLLDKAPIDDPYDYNRDGLVNGTDQIIARSHQSNPLTMLRLLAAPPADAVMQQVGGAKADGLAVSQAQLDWLFEFAQTNAKTRAARRNKAVAPAVDELVAYSDL